MAVEPLWKTNGNSPSVWTWAANYGWIHFENYYFKYGSKTHVSHLPSGTPWRYPTEYGLDIYNIKNLADGNSDDMRFITQYPDGTQYIGSLFGSASDVFFVMDAEGWRPGNVNHQNFDSNLLNGAITKALDKLANQKADMGTNIAEGREAIHMVTGNSSKIWKAMLALRRGNLKGILSALEMNPRDVLYGKFPANRWLEYQFGWKPLIEDIYDSYQKFHEVVNRDLVVTGKGSMKVQKSGEQYFGPNGGPWTVDAKAMCRIDAFIRTPELRQANQWNLINPLALAWEVEPFSFAVDWFMPIGGTLEALTASAGLDFLSGSQTQIRETRQSASFQGSGGFTIIQDGKVEIEKFQMRREPLYTFPFPQFYAKTKNPFSSTHTANALALWRQIPPLR